MDPFTFPLLPPLPPQSLVDPVAHSGEGAVALLLSVLARTTVVLAAGLLLGALLGCRDRRRGGAPFAGPAARASVYRATLAAVALTAAVTVAAGMHPAGAPSTPLVRLTIPAVPRPVRALLPRVFATRIAGADRVVVVRTAAVAGAVTPTPRAALPALYAAVLWAYGAGAALLLLALGRGLLRLRRLSRAAHTLEAGTPLGMQMERAWCARLVRDGVGRKARRPRPRLAAAEGLEGPFIADVPALATPTVFVPAGEREAWTDEDARAVFAHELAHHARRDGAWNLAARVVTALLWCQPLIHPLRRRLEDATEEACDRDALECGGCPPHSLARCLLTLAERQEERRRALLRGRRGRFAFAPALSAVSPPFRSSVGRRVALLLEVGADPPRPHRPAPRGAVPALALTAAVVAAAPVAASRLVAVERATAAATTGPVTARWRVSTGAARPRLVEADVLVLRRAAVRLHRPSAAPRGAVLITTTETAANTTATVVRRGGGGEVTEER